jgi:ABC-type branched-subunit amino acid transport system ATPase component
MASGILGQVSITGTSVQSVYGPAPAGKTATINVLACNLANNMARLFMSVANTSYASPPANSYLEFNTQFGAGDVFERGGIVLGQGSYIYLWTNTPSPVTGYEV